MCRAKAAAQARQQEDAQVAAAAASQAVPTVQTGHPHLAEAASFPATARHPDAGSQQTAVEHSSAPPHEGKPLAASHSSTSRAASHRQSQHGRKQRGDSRQSTFVGGLRAGQDRTPLGSVSQAPGSLGNSNDGSKPRVLEVRRPRRPRQQGSSDTANNAIAATEAVDTASIQPGSH